MNNKTICSVILSITTALIVTSCVSGLPTPQTPVPPTYTSPTPTTPPITVPPTTTKTTTPPPVTTTKTTAVQAFSPLTVPGQQFTGGIMTQGGSSTFFVDKGPLIAFGGAPTSGYTWSLAAGSTLPQGTTFDPTTGMFYQGGSGVAILPGTWTFKMVVSDGSSKATGTFTLVVNVGSSMNPIPKADFQKSLAADIPYPDAKVGMGYGASLWCTGDGALPWKWTIMDGSLPPGLELNQASGIIYGTPLPAAAGNTYHFRISVKDAIGVEAIGDPTYSIIVAK